MRKPYIASTIILLFALTLTGAPNFKESQTVQERLTSLAYANDNNKDVNEKEKKKSTPCLEKINDQQNKIKKQLQEIKKQISASLRN